LEIRLLAVLLYLGWLILLQAQHPVLELKHAVNGGERRLELVRGDRKELVAQPDGALERLLVGQRGELPRDGEAEHLFPRPERARSADQQPGVIHPVLGALRAWG